MEGKPKENCYSDIFEKGQFFTIGLESLDLNKQNTVTHLQ